LLPNLNFRSGRFRLVSAAPESRDQWVLTDEPIQGSKDDRFRHVDVAANMAEIVWAEDPPEVVGLLGAFGTDKSSVGELLAERLQDDRELAVVRVSADKHTGSWSETASFERTRRYLGRDSTERSSSPAMPLEDAIRFTSASTEGVG
jgi:hypothetical protein